LVISAARSKGAGGNKGTINAYAGLLLSRRTFATKSANRRHMHRSK
jgi:hypothetical protein